MATIRVRDQNGNVIDIPALRGKSAYQYALDGGYTGTEEEFKAKMAAEWATKEEVDELSNEIEELKENGTGSGGVVVSSLEPADDDIPHVYFTGTLPTSKSEGDVPVTIRYISKTQNFKFYATLKVQGGSSANYAKKNFTLKMYEDDALENKVKYAFKNWGELNKWVLKAHWIDHSHVRNVGTAKIWGKIVESRSDYDSLPEELRNAPNNGATDGFTCKVFANGIYQGLYEWIVPKDKLFGQDSDNVKHSIMNSELNNQATCAFATTTPTISGNWSEELQDSMSSEISTSFANLIKFVAGATDEEFVANAENYFDVQSVIDYDIFARVFCIVDNLCRNQIFFTYDGSKWYEGVWDVDAILGLPPTTRGFFAYNTEFQTGYIAYKDYSITNMLYQRVEMLYLDRFKARYEELRADILSIENIIDVYERLTDVIKTYDGLLEEDFATTTGDGKFTGIPYTSENNIQQIRTFVSQRLPYMDDVISNMNVTELIPATSITLSASTLTFTDETTQTITATIEPSDSTDTVSWKSSDTNIAKVIDGVVTPVSNGSCTITATAGTVSSTCEVFISGFEESESESDVLNNFYASTWTTGMYNDYGEMETTMSMHHSELMPIPDVYTRVSTSATSNMYLRITYFDENKEFIGWDRGFGLNSHDANNSEQLIDVSTEEVPNATYYAINANTDDKKDVIISSYEIDLQDNLIDGVWHYGTLNGMTGAVINSTVDITTNAFDIGQYVGETIVLMVIGECSSNSQKIIYFDNDGAFLSSTYSAAKESIVPSTVPDNAVTAKISMNSKAVGCTIHHDGIQIGCSAVVDIVD